MIIINARSPYFITVNESGQVGSKVELFIWNDGTTEPATPTYTFAKTISQRTDYNISNFVKEYIDNSISYVASPATNDVKNWCKVKVKRYKETTIGSYTLLDTVSYLAVNGYNNYSENSVLQNSSIITYYERSNTEYPYIEAVFDTTIGDTLTARYTSGITTVDIGIILVATPSGQYNIKIPLTTNNANFDNGNTLTVFYNGSPFSIFKCEPIEEGKYSPVVCQFINRYGGAQFLTFFKAKTDSIDVKGTTYKISGQTKNFNINGTQKVKLNTGWVDENYSDLITDLFLSESVWLDGKPAIVKTQSSVLKTHLKDKNINYEIDFEYSFNLINDVI